MTGFVFRSLAGMAEFRAAEDLQRTVWGADDLPDPADLMMVIQAEGGLVGGAFLDGALQGYVFGFPTRDPEVQHSHRLAVRPESRGYGLGVRLKLWQRQWCLDHGIHHVRWTFDPLRATNASLNIHRLGAEVRDYLVDYYGDMAGINRGIASDRLLVDWDLRSPVVEALAGGLDRPASNCDAINPSLPGNLDWLLANDPNHAARLRMALRDAMQAALASGRLITDFDNRTRSYLLAPAS